MVHQGDLLKLKNPSFHILILSKDFFNQSGMAVACPVVEQAAPDALHIPVKTEEFSGVAMIEQLRSLDLQTRHYKTVGTISFEQIQNVSDAAASLFDYYPFSLE